MNIAIVGAGITGISTALEFARDGHQVTVYEQLNASAEDASFAPGGWLNPLAAHSFATPSAGMPLKLLKSGKDLLQATNIIGSSTWRWLRQWRKHEKNIQKQKEHSFLNALCTLENYSASLLWQDCEDKDIAAEHKTGHLIILRTPQEAELWHTLTPQLLEHRIHCKLLEPPQVHALEPGLGSEIPWINALHFPHAQSINPRLWTHYLRTQAQELGVNFCTGTSVEQVSTHPIGVVINQQLQLADHVILCTGNHPQLLAQIGLRLPIMPIYGYSVTAPVREPLNAPRSAIMDWAQQATISRMGQRVRITAGLEVGSSATTPHNTATLQRMYRLLNDWFPGGAHLSSPQVQVWRGVRGYLPDGLPIVSSSGHKGIWLNIAHGSHGISLASGSARALADMAQNRAPAIDMQAFAAQRF